MVEKHPFGNFVPENSRYLLLGSFVSKPMDGYDWFYANNRNQFWPILEKVYGVELRTKDVQQKLFQDLGMALADVIYECERQNNSNLDVSLKEIVVNHEIGSIVCDNPIEVIYFSSRFAETLYKKHFKGLINSYPKVKYVVLPSPSPRYAAMSKADKIVKYKELMPEFKK